jgi:tetratricopeptide (TPR) repeat protein
MRVVSVITLFVACIFRCLNSTAQQAPIFYFNQTLGPYAVGVRVVEQYDYSRAYHSSTDILGKPYTGERARPLQTLIWYPAIKSNKQPMTVGDYANLLKTETDFTAVELPAERKKLWIDGMSRTLSSPLWAVRDAPEISGHFPVVIYAPSLDASSWENADLCEYLATYGYVVIASPDMGANKREMTQDVKGPSAQAQDISFLIGYAHSLANTDMSEIAVAGFSWGGLSNLFAAARDSRIDALVCLDGSLRYYPGLVQEAGDIHPELMTIPMIYFANGESTIEEDDSNRTYIKKTLLENVDGRNVLNAWTHGDLITAHMLGFVHPEFGSMLQRNDNMWTGFPKVQMAGYGREDGVIGYGLVAKYTLEFLNAYLKHDPAAIEFLKRPPSENGAPKHFMSLNYRVADGPPASFETLLSELGRQGYDHLANIYDAMHNSDTAFTLDQATLNSWASDLMNEGHVPEAAYVYEFVLALYPQSHETYLSLGNAYRDSGQDTKAVKAYKQGLLEIHNPAMIQALQRNLKAIETDMTGQHK